MELSLRIILTSITLLWSIKTYKCSEGYKPEDNVENVLVNSAAEIKCDVLSSIVGDDVLLVVWYKNNLPIYSYDTRGTHAGTPSHWKDEEILENRAIFRTVRAPAELIINPVKEKDAGNFRCRVDFKLSPTRNSNVNLQVVVPPSIPVIYNEKGEPIESRAGPYDETGELSLMCVVMGGSPPPSVKWLQNGQELSTEIMDFTFPSRLTNKLVVKNLSRIHQHAVYTCQASNFPKKYVTKNITIDLYLRPLLVEILFNQQPLSADRRYEVECQSVGSRPSSIITWWMGGESLIGAPAKTSLDGNVTTSTLFFTPIREDNGKSLVCRATNELVKNGVKETVLKLNIFFIPRISLGLGSNLNPEDIEEGDDVYFECKVHANPAAYKVVWKHDGQNVLHNPKQGVIMSAGNLALQGVTKYQAGNYTCIASNVEGDGESNIVELRVMYKPLCRPEQKRVYGVARNEAAEILCEVDAFPAPESFKWSFNNTAETFEMPQNDYKIHTSQAASTLSTLSYTPVKELDFGTILCWADNVVGQQKEPCVFHLIAAGKPDVPYNCSLINQTSDSLEVDCNEGFDGGQRQWFIMEIFDQQTHVLQANISSKFPIFTASGLLPGKLLKINIYAVNVKGRSDSVLLEAFTLKAAEKQPFGPSEQYDLSPILSFGILVGILTAFVCVIIGVIALLKLRTSSNKKPSGQQRPGNLQIKEKISLPLSQSEEMYDEKNPDVVPSNEDPEYKLKSANQTPTVLNNALSNKGEIIGRNCEDNRQGYTAGSNDVQYAELALQMPKEDIKNQMNHNHIKKPPPPPAYTAYFDDPTIYAQIDHSSYNNSKTSSTNLLGNSATSLTNGGILNQTAQYVQLISPLSHTSTTILNNQSLLLTEHCLDQSLSPTTSIGNSYHTQTLQHPTKDTIGRHPANSKQYMREMVTVRTPLSFSEQESCV